MPRYRGEISFDGFDPDSFPHFEKITKPRSGFQKRDRFHREHHKRELEVSLSNAIWSRHAFQISRAWSRLGTDQITPKEHAYYVRMQEEYPTFVAEVIKITRAGNQDNHV